MDFAGGGRKNVGSAAEQVCCWRAEKTRRTLNKVLEVEDRGVRHGWQGAEIERGEQRKRTRGSGVSCFFRSLLLLC